MGFVHTHKSECDMTQAGIELNNKNVFANLPINRKKYLNKFTLYDIFKAHWPDFSKRFAHRLTRKAIHYNVESMLACGNKELGYAFFECKNCNNYHMVHFTCKSRFCPKCNYKYSTARTVNFTKKAIDSNYRHIVFTIPDFLRNFFRIDRSSLNTLFDAVNDTLRYMCQDTKASKLRKDTFGFMLSLHTYGRDMKWNPHIHCLIAECKIGNDNIIRRYNYFHYNRLRKSFQFRILERLKEYFGESPKYKAALKRSYRNNSKGFYVYAPPLQVKSFNKAKDPVKELVGYITRYAAHPPIAESRITNVDYDKDTVTFFYEPHEDDQKESKDKVGKVEVTLSSDEFIGLLIQHIPDFKFHNIRYYGFMSNASVIDTSKTRKLYPKIHINKLIISLKYLYRLYECYKYDPLLCECGEYMVFNKELSYFGGG